MQPNMQVQIIANNLSIEACAMQKSFLEQKFPFGFYAFKKVSVKIQCTYVRNCPYCGGTTRIKTIPSEERHNNERLVGGCNKKDCLGHNVAKGYTTMEVASKLDTRAKGYFPKYDDNIRIILQEVIVNLKMLL